jgi:hypothetical protein
MNMNFNLIDSAAYYNRIIIQSRYDKCEDCSICLESLLNKKISYLPCKHVFHSSCLNHCFSSKLYNCPLCRHDLIEPLNKINFPTTGLQPNLSEFTNSYFYYYGDNNEFLTTLVVLDTGNLLIYNFYDINLISGLNEGNDITEGNDLTFGNTLNQEERVLQGDVNMDGMPRLTNYYDYYHDYHDYDDYEDDYDDYNDY